MVISDCTLIPLTKPEMDTDDMVDSECVFACLT
ncbi:hypothetical protein THIX_10103 [Thiomonas sp. X19]|uniref:Uncharacterized protein n=1 Tax=mine drainage metagenome TaxID=410659 RepID=E6PMC5_9ZZZZ|nr:hypothetical protein THIX_10103 [Thiomonas sp. X19]